MKTKILSSFLIALFAILLSSCEGPMGPQGPAGIGSWDVFEMTVEGQDWRWDSNREVFYYEFNERAISSFIASKGLVQVAINVDGTYYPLTDVRHLYDGNDYITETVSYEYATGWIRFNFSASDLFDNAAGNYKPDTHRFKVTLLW